MAKQQNNKRPAQPRSGEPSMDKIRRAITAHCGGWDEATDEQILRKWRDLPHETQTQYLSGVDAPKEKPKHDDRSGPERNVPGPSAEA